MLRRTVCKTVRRTIGKEEEGGEIEGRQGGKIERVG